MQLAAQGCQKGGTLLLAAILARRSDLCIDPAAGSPGGQVAQTTGMQSLL
jgi:hypothetical protein